MFSDMNKWLRFGLGAVVALVLLFALVFEISVPLPIFESAETSVIENQAVRERIAIDTAEDSYLYNGADLILYSNDHLSSTITLDGSVGAIEATTITATTWVTESTDLALTGDLTVGDDATVTADLTAATVAVGGGYGATGCSISAAGVLQCNGAATTDGALTADSAVIGGGYGSTGCTLSNAGVLQCNGAATVGGALSVTGMSTLTGGATGVINTENVMLPTVLSVPITYTAAAGGTGTVATITDGEIWFVHAVLVDVTTNFDATGDDATLVVGDGNDADGFIVLADAELQAADTEGTGFTAGWQGMAAATQGVYLDGNWNGFVYAPSGADETIDYLIDEADGETLSAGAATIYVVYTRIQ